ncbi:MAG: hypothetical protein AAF483_09175 [Planctomycetota bacterium]
MIYDPRLWILIGFIAMLVIVFVAVNLMEARRKKAMESLAREFGFEYSSADEQPLVAQLEEVYLIPPRSPGSVSNVMRGHKDGIEIVIMDYTRIYKERNLEVTVAMLSSDQLNLPHFFMTPEHAGIKLALSMSGLSDINFDSHPQFSSKYLLLGHDEVAIRKRFGNDVLKLFENENGWTVFAHDDKIFLYRGNKKTAVSQIKNSLDQSIEVLNLLKP